MREHRGARPFCRIAAILACLALALGGLLAPMPAKAADTNNDLFTTLPGAPVGVTFYDVAWSADGKLALFVGTDYAHGKAYYYQPEGDVWTEALFGGGFLPCYILYTVTYCPDSWSGAKFMGAGTSGGTGYYLWFPGPGQDTDYSNTVALFGFEVHDSIYNPAIGSMGSLYLIANSASGNEIKLIELDLASGAPNPIIKVPKVSAACFGVECDPVTNDVYIVGVQSSGVLYHKYQHNTSTNYSLPFPYGVHLSDIVYDSYHTPKRMIVTALFQAVGDVTSVFDVRFSGGNYSFVIPIGQTPDYTYFNSIAIDSDGRAVLVGMDDELTNYGRIYDLWTGSSGTTHLMIRSEGIIAGEEFKGVAIRPTGVQMALVAGSAFKYSYTSVLGPIQVDVAVPHVDFMDLYPTGSPGDDKLNSQIDVDIGDGGTTYTLEVGVYDSLGVARMTEIEVWMWFDAGATGVDLPTSLGAGFDAAGTENTRMHFRITRAGPTITQIFPAPGPTAETNFVNGWWSDINATAATVTLDFQPHQQVRWAPGPFTPGFPGNPRYDPDMDGPEPGEQSTVSALNDGLTWDIKARVADDATTTNYASAYDEFGIYRYTYLGVAGIPNGGAVYGSGAPGTNNVVMSVSGANVTYSANCPYGLSVQLMSDLNGISYAGMITAAAISIQGGAIAVPTVFLATGSTQTLIGPAQAPLNAGRTTTTSSWDGNAATWEPVRWWVDIPGVLEDQYVSQVTWAITN
jgi:hypothetical protein